MFMFFLNVYVSASYFSNQSDWLWPLIVKLDIDFFKVT